MGLSSSKIAAEDARDATKQEQKRLLAEKHKPESPELKKAGTEPTKPTNAGNETGGPPGSTGGPATQGSGAFRASSTLVLEDDEPQKAPAAKKPDVASIKVTAAPPPSTPSKSLTPQASSASRSTSKAAAAPDGPLHAEAAAWVQLLGEPIVTGAYSGEWANREAAMKSLGQAASSGALLHDRSAAPATASAALALLQQAVKDKITPVFFAAAEALVQVATAADALVDSAVLQRPAVLAGVEPSLASLAARACNLNARIAAESSKALLALADLDLVSHAHVGSMLRASGGGSKKALPADQVRPRLELHLKMLQAPRGAGLACFAGDAAAALDYPRALLSHADDKVRKAAARLFVEVYRLARSSPSMAAAVTPEVLASLQGTPVSKQLFQAVAKVDADKRWAPVFTPEEEAKPASALPAPGAGRPKPVLGPVRDTSRCAMADRVGSAGDDGGRAAPAPSAAAGGQAWAIDADDLARSVKASFSKDRGPKSLKDSHSPIELEASLALGKSMNSRQAIPGALNDDDEQLLDAILNA